MYVNKKIELHTKYLAVLCLIDRLNDRIQGDEVTLGNWERANYYDILRMAWKREEIEQKIEMGYAARERLVKYYQRIMDALLTRKPEQHETSN